MFTEESLKILVPLFTAMLVVFIGYFINKSQYERKRKDELADREFNRNVEIRDMRIKEARGYADNIHTMLVLLGGVTAALLKSIDVPDPRQQLSEYIEDVAQITELHQVLAVQRMTVDVLNDDEITALHTKLYSYFLNYSIYLSNTMEGIFKGTSTNIDAEKLKKHFRIAPDTDKLVRAMKHRLDELSQTVKQ